MAMVEGTTEAAEMAVGSEAAMVRSPLFLTLWSFS